MAFHQESSFLRYFSNHAMMEFIHFVRFTGSIMPWFSPSTSINAVGTPSSFRAVYICMDSPRGTLVSAVPWVKRMGFVILSALYRGDLSTKRSLRVQG